MISVGLAAVLSLTGCGTATDVTQDRWEPNASASASRNDAIAEVVGRWNYLGDFQVEAASLVVSPSGAATYTAGDDPTDYTGTVKAVKQSSDAKQKRYRVSLSGQGKTLEFSLRMDSDGRSLHITDEAGDTRIFAREV